MSDQLRDFHPTGGPPSRLTPTACPSPPARPRLPRPDRGRPPSPHRGPPPDSPVVPPSLSPPTRPPCPRVPHRLPSVERSWQAVATTPLWVATGMDWWPHQRQPVWPVEGCYDLLALSKTPLAGRRGVEISCFGGHSEMGNNRRECQTPRRGPDFSSFQPSK